MQISDKTLAKWRKVREKGDNQKIAEMCDLDEATVSRVLTGKQETDSENLLKMKDFFQKKLKIKEAIEK